MKETFEYCDVCHKQIGDDPFVSPTKTERVEYRISHRTLDEFDDDIYEFDSLTLCHRCNEQLKYVIRNRAVLDSGMQKMKLPNRIRFLFGFPLKIERSSV